MFNTLARGMVCLPDVVFVCSGCGFVCVGDRLYLCDGIPSVNTININKRPM